MKTDELVKLLHKSKPTVMAGIKQGVFPFATAFKREPDNKKHKIFIYEEKVKEYITGTDKEFDLTIAGVARLTGETEKTIRDGMKNGIFPFGVAFKTKPENRDFEFVFYPAKLAEYIGEAS